MAFACKVPGCCKVQGDIGVSFFRFPSDEIRCAEWKQKLGFVGYHKYSNHTAMKCRSFKVCSLHFDDGYFLNIQKNRLSAQAIPTQLLPYKYNPSVNNLSSELYKKKIIHIKTAAIPIHYQFNPQSLATEDEWIRVANSSYLQHETLPEEPHIKTECDIDYTDNSLEQEQSEEQNVANIKREIDVEDENIMSKITIKTEVAEANTVLTRFQPIVPKLEPEDDILRTDSRFEITGTRLVNISYFWEQIKMIRHHPYYTCTLNDCYIVNEEKNREVSKFTVGCNVCGCKTIINTDRVEEAFN